MYNFLTIDFCGWGLVVGPRIAAIIESNNHDCNDSNWYHAKYFHKL